MMSFRFTLIICSFYENSVLENEAFTAFSVATSAFPVNTAVLLPESGQFEGLCGEMLLTLRFEQLATSPEEQSAQIE